MEYKMSVDIIIRVDNHTSQVLFKGFPVDIDEFKLAGYLFCLNNKCLASSPNELNRLLSISEDDVTSTYRFLLDSVKSNTQGQ
jgi:hypothetical protein